MNVYSLLADAIAAIHLAIVVFVVGGLALVLLGVALHWTWVRNFWFRALHLATIVFVVGQSWCGILCPLTRLEDLLRQAGGTPSEPTWFVGRLIHRLLFVNISPAVLSVCYTVFGLCVLAAFILAPPRRRPRS